MLRRCIFSCAAKKTGLQEKLKATWQAMNTESKSQKYRSHFSYFKCNLRAKKLAKIAVKQPDKHRKQLSTPESSGKTEHWCSAFGILGSFG